MSMTTPLPGIDPLIPTSLVGHESISECFTYQIQAISQIGPIDPTQLLNLPVCVTLRNTDGPVRYFHGIVQDLRDNGVVRGATAADEFNAYSLVVMPRLWFLKQTHDCRVYQNKTVADILQAVFHDANLTDVNIAAAAGAARPYTVQFNESDYHFVNRLMEEEGWFFWFEHSDSKHNLVIADKNSSFTDISGATLHFASQPDDPTGITQWARPERTATGSIALADYDPVNPGTKLHSKATTLLKTGGASARDVFHWPALTSTGSVVESRAKFGLEAAEAATSLYHGGSIFGSLVPGGKFNLTNSPASKDDGAFAIRSVDHYIQDDSWISQGGSVSYHNNFDTFQFSRAWRQAIITPRPRMEGIHSALVMGPQSAEGADIKMQSGEEIYTDDLARVKVRFYWDWRAEATGGASVWARVIQPWAGNGWGTQFIPRVGTEVAVAFVDGDPDRPIVIGGLYNGVSAPIYSKSDATKSGIRTRSSLKGDTSKFNELTFDDKAGNELIFIHAEKDLTTEVEHDESLTVDNCRVVLVKVDETITVKGKQTITVTKDHSFEVKEGNTTYKITKGDSSFEVTKGNHSAKIGTGNSTFEVSKGNHSEKIGMGNAAYEVSMGNHNLKVGMGNQATDVTMGNYDLKLGLGNITVKTGVGQISMEALQGIELKVGPSSVKIDMMGVTIKGMMLKIEGTIMTDIKGLMTKVGGDAMLMVKGAITMIN